MLSYPDYKEKQVVICFSKEKQKISFLNDNLIIKDEGDKIILQNSCYKIFSLWIIGSITLTSGILERSKKFAFPISFFSYGFRNYGTWNSSTEGNFLLRQKQYEYSGIDSARLIIQNKIGNQIEIMKTIRNKNIVQKRAIESLNTYLLKLPNSLTIQEIMGVEGIASRVYFESWFFDLEWNGRMPRAKRDILNTLMDIGYTFLFNMIEAMLNLYGFDLYKGVLHQSFYQRKSLVCDLVEPFRCIIDRQLKNAFNLGQINPEDFKEIKGQFVLNYDKYKIYTKWLLVALLDEKESIFHYTQGYYRWFIKGKQLSDFPYFKI
jgi:CRISPR-associated protein Cas1